MKYFSLDVETTGLNKNTHQVIELGGVIDDLKDKKPIKELPEFHCFITHENYTVSEYVLGMHSDSGIWKKLQERPDEYNFYSPQEASKEISKFIYLNLVEEDDRNIPFRSCWNQVINDHTVPDNEECPVPFEVVAAGKNFAAFDKDFLYTLPYLEKMVRFHHRVIDPGPLYMNTSDETPPNLSTCLERAGFDDTEISHTAVDDAIDVVKLIRKYYLNSD